MALPYSITRIVLVAFICSSFCGLGWSHLGDAPERIYDQNILTETSYDEPPMFVTCHLEPHNGLGKPVREEVSTSVFHAAPLATLTFGISKYEERISPGLAKAQSIQGDCMSNKDPPAGRDDPVLRLSCLAPDLFELSYHETLFFTSLLPCFQLSINRLLAFEHAGSGSRASGTSHA